MKRIWLFSIVLLTILIINSCSEAQKESKVESQKSKVEPQKSQEYKVNTKNLKLVKKGERAHFGNGSFLVSDMMIDDNQKYKKIPCNTTMLTVAKTCDSMYDIYRKEYNYVTSVTHLTSIDMHTCDARARPVYRQLKDYIEEQCDEQLRMFIIRNTQLLGCLQVLNKEKLLYKKEFCLKHIKH